MSKNEAQVKAEQREISFRDSAMKRGMEVNMKEIRSEINMIVEKLG